MRVLVTGSTGYLGRALVGRLVEHGHEPVAFARRASQAGLPGRAIDGDVRDRAALGRAAEGCDAMVHLAAVVSIWQSTPTVFDEVNVVGLDNAVAAARHARLRRLVYTSSFLALPPAGRTAPLRANDYQRTKAEALVVARKALHDGAPLVIMVPGVIYGPGIRSEGNLVGRLIADHLANRLPGIVGADRIWSFSFVSDVADAHVVAIERGDEGAEYGVGGDNAPQRAIFEWLQARTGRALPRDLPPWVARGAGLVEEWRARLTGRTPLVTRGAVEIFRHDWPVDSARATTELGYRPRPLAEGLDETLDELNSATAPPVDRR